MNRKMFVVSYEDRLNTPRQQSAFEATWEYIVTKSAEMERTIPATHQAGDPYVAYMDERLDELMALVGKRDYRSLKRVRDLAAMFIFILMSEHEHDQEWFSKATASRYVVLRLWRDDKDASMMCLRPITPEEWNAAGNAVASPESLPQLARLDFWSRGGQSVSINVLAERRQAAR